MDCKKARRLIKRGKSMDPETSSKLRIHLEKCQSCRLIFERIEISNKALQALKPLQLPEEKKRDILDAIRKEKGKGRKASTVKWFQSPRNLAIAAGAVACLIAILVVVGLGVFQGKPGYQEISIQKSEKEVPKAPVDGAVEEYSESKDFISGLNAPQRLGPLVTFSDNNYDQSSLRETFENLVERKSVAKNFTCASAILLGFEYRQKIIEEYKKLEAKESLSICSANAPSDEASTLAKMLYYVTSGEPVQLPIYVERAKFNGESVIIIGLAGPRFGRKSSKLKRFDVWVLDPYKFEKNPDSSIVLMLQLIEK